MNQLTSSILYSLFVENVNKNWVFSPASYLEAMSLLSLCIKDENLAELLSVAPDIAGPQAEGLDTSNYLLCAREYEAALDQITLAAIEDHGGDLNTFDSPSQAVRLVNDLVKVDAHGKITDLLRDGDVDEMTKFVILNCVYFKAKWLHDFTLKWAPEPFNGATETVGVKYLTRELKYRYAEHAVADIVELPYRDSDVACYLVVPHTSLFEVFNDLRSVLAKVGEVKEDRTVALSVPPFKTESTLRDLAALTQRAGVKKAFEWTKDWSLINWDLVKPETVLKVQGIIQKAYLDFTKEGTEAAAATAVLIGVSGCCFSPPAFPPPPPKIVRADKPFMYILANRTDGKPLFMGVVNDLPDEAQRDDQGRHYTVDYGNGFLCTGERKYL